jgi:hypothetical protein
MSAADGKPGPGLTEVPYGGGAPPAGAAPIPATIPDTTDVPLQGATAVPQAGSGFDPPYPPYEPPPPTQPMIAPAPPVRIPASAGRARPKRGQGLSLPLIGLIAFVVIGGVVTAVALGRRPSNNDDDGPAANTPPAPVTVASDPGPAPDPQSPPDPGPAPVPPTAAPPPRRPGVPQLPRLVPSTQPSNRKPSPKPSASAPEPKRDPFPIPIPFF